MRAEKAARGHASPARKKEDDTVPREEYEAMTARKDEYKRRLKQMKASRTIEDFTEEEICEHPKVQILIEQRHRFRKELKDERQKNQRLQEEVAEKEVTIQSLQRELAAMRREVAIALSKAERLGDIEWRYAKIDELIQEQIRKGNISGDRECPY